MLVGNLGSKYRFAYGVLGDHVNLGSRLEGLNKQYGTDILIGENTAQLVEKSFLLREVDLVRVVGREQPVRIYELLAKAGDVACPGSKKRRSVPMPPGWRHTASSAGTRPWGCSKNPWPVARGWSVPHHGRTLPDLPENTPARRVGWGV